MINGGLFYFGYVDLCVILYSVFVRVVFKIRDLMLWCAVLIVEKDGCVGS